MALTCRMEEPSTASEADSLFDEFVGTQHQSRGDIDPQSLRDFKVYDELERRRHFDRKIAGLLGTKRVSTSCDLKRFSNCLPSL